MICDKCNAGELIKKKYQNLYYCPVCDKDYYFKEDIAQVEEGEE